MKRRLFTLASALSLLLLVATGVLWARSYWAGESWWFASRPSTLSMQYSVPDPHAPPGPERVEGTSWRSQRVLISAKGRLQIYRREFPLPWDNTPSGHLADGEIHRVNWTLSGYGTPPGERHRITPYFQFSARPAWTDGQGALAVGYWSLVVPWWVLFLVTGILPAAWTRRRWRDSRMASRRRQNRCVICGYDLRASRDRCPECGTPAAEGAKAPA